jgi:putative chitinase
VGKVPAYVLDMMTELAGFFPENKGGNTPLRLAHFIGQCAHESAGFYHVYECLNYSADGLRKYFPQYFPDQATALAYAHNEERIASRLYANRMGNGNEASKDGYRFRGRGYIQLTGKDHYRYFSKFIGKNCIVNPDLVAEQYPLLSAAFFFSLKDIWRLCDQGSLAENVASITHRINGGFNGLDQRMVYFKYFSSIIFHTTE